MVIVCGVTPAVGVTESHVPPEGVVAVVAVKFRLPELAVTSTVVLTAPVVPALAKRLTLL
jgi:hypothetical protein